MKIQSHKIVETLKEKEKKERRENVTFRLNSELVKDFKGKCKKDKVGAGKVIEELLKAYMEN